MYLYYKAFNIYIFQYISVSDLLFFSIEQLTILTCLIIGLEILGFFIYNLLIDLILRPKVRSEVKKRLLRSDKKNNKQLVDRFVWRVQKKRMASSLHLLSMLVGVIICVISYLPFFHSLQHSLFIAGFTYFMYRGFLYRGRNMEKQKLQNVILITVYILIIGLMVLQAGSDAKNVITKDELDHKLSFDYGEKHFSVNSRIRYIGETSTYIFLYDKKVQETLIFPKTKIDNLKINAKDSFLYNRVKNDK